MEESRYFTLFASRAIREAAKFLGEASSLTTTGPPLPVSLND
jgi:hypothetical protein